MKTKFNDFLNEDRTEDAQVKERLEIERFKNEYYMI